MNFFTGWISTILASSFIDLYTSGRIFKDVADNGYLIDFDKLKSFSSLSDVYTEKKSKLIGFIPLANMAKSMTEYMEYQNTKAEVLNSFGVLDVVVEMNEEEKEKYEKKPTIINATKLNIFRMLDNDREKLLKEALDELYDMEKYIDYLNYYKIKSKAKEEYEKDLNSIVNPDTWYGSKVIKESKVIDLKSKGKIYYKINDNKRDYELEDFRITHIEGKFSETEHFFTMRRVFFMLSHDYIYDAYIKQHTKTISGYNKEVNKKYIKVR